MRIVFMGSPGFAVPSLNAIHASRHKVIAVVTQPDRPFGRKLKMHAPEVKVASEKLRLSVLQPATTKTAEFVQQIADLKPEALVIVAYGEILRPALLDTAPLGALNLHASLLPKYRGAAPVAWSIWNGESETGCTTMRVSDRMDAGDILMQAPCEIQSKDTTGSLLEKLATIGAPLLVETLDRLESGTIQGRPQEESEVTYASKLKKDHGWIRWNQPAVSIERQIRALDPWPGSFSELNGVRVKIWRAALVTQAGAMPPGAILDTAHGAIRVATGGATAIDLMEVQPENRPRMSAIDFVNGFRVQIGQQFLSPQVS